MQNSRYILKAACCGCRPSQFASHNGRQRPYLVAHMAKERSTARFIVAPVGYGKTSLAFDYADLMFSWAHVFWLNAASPCFIRDLDDGDLARECIGRDSEAKLVVMDDLPLLDAHRAELLSKEIDLLLAAGCEVVAICTPSCDCLGKLQRDRLRICANDLLLTDNELDALRSSDERARTPSSKLPASSRVPSLTQGADREATWAFLSGILNEALPNDFKLALFSTLVLREGSFLDLEKSGSLDRRLVADVMDDYPHFGFDTESQRFEAPLVGVDDIAHVLKKHLSMMRDSSRFDTRDELVLSWANILLDRTEDVGRACDVVRTMCTVKNRSAWAIAHFHTFVDCACFYPWFRILQDLQGVSGVNQTYTLMAEALCRRMMGDVKGAVRCAKRIAFSDKALPHDRACALIMLGIHASGELRSNALGALACWEENGDEGVLGPCSWWNALVRAWNGRMRGLEELGITWRALRDEGVDEGVLCIVSSWLFDMAGDALCISKGVGLHAGAALKEAERFVRALLPKDGLVHVGFLAASAGLALEQAHAKGLELCAGPLEAPVLLALRRVELSVLTQRRQAEDDWKKARLQREGANMLEGPIESLGADLAIKIPRHAVPILSVRLFGQFEVSIGGVPCESKGLSRKNARLLLALLAANRGRDISREVIIESMWPDSKSSHGRKSFYTAWSALKTALTLPDGTCPYLARHSFGCRLEERYVQSDVARLDAICRQLLFGRLDVDEWMELYAEIDQDFSCDLLPSERKNPIIVRTRNDLRTRLVDALIAATARLTSAGFPENGIWFARAAIRHERTREDAYLALMRAQIANNQRTAAMMTYLELRKVLNEELGIDPSPEATELYESLLEG